MSNLSPVQFSFHKTMVGHQVLAHVDNKPVGKLEWAGATGKIQEVFVSKPHRRKGIATSMLEQSRTMAKEKGLQTPVHSERRSDDGQAWAASTKDKLPERKSDRELRI
jgi:GNAT superfamily N-acetyltransferase